MDCRHRKDGEHDYFVPRGYAPAEQPHPPRMTLLVSGDEFLCSRRTCADGASEESPLGSGGILRIDKHTYAFTCESSCTYPEFVRRMTIAAVLGVLHRRDEGFLVVVTEAVFVGKVCGASVFGIRSAELLPFELQASWAGRSRSDAVTKEVRSIEHTLSTAGFYFSYGMDLSLPISSSTGRSSSCDDDTGFSDQFCWNREMGEDLRTLPVPYDREWCTALIHGSVTADVVDLDGDALVAPPMHRPGNKANIALVARRSRLRSWPHSAVGLDEEGNSAGLVSTQLVVEVDSAVASLQVLTSVGSCVRKMQARS